MEGKGCSVLCTAEFMRLGTKASPTILMGWGEQQGPGRWDWNDPSYILMGWGEQRGPGRWDWNDPQSLCMHMATQRRKRGVQKGWA